MRGLKARDPARGTVETFAEREEHPSALKIGKSLPPARDEAHVRLAYAGDAEKSPIYADGDEEGMNYTREQYRRFLELTNPLPNNL